jgi:hypothetical protein
VAVIRVLYLPRDDRLRSLVRLALDFVEEVYRDDVLSDLKFVSFNPDDRLFDVKQVERIAKREGFELDPISFDFYGSHYNYKKAYAWVPVSRESKISDIFEDVVHEVTHHALHKLPAEDRAVLTTALRIDLGREVDEMIGRLPRPLSFELADEITKIVNETTTTYITYNYFVILEREPRTPTPQSNIRDFVRIRSVDLLIRPIHEATIMSRIYTTMARHDLPNYRRAIHEMFTKLTKRFPVDVLESNRAKYEILYRGGRTI